MSGDLVPVDPFHGYLDDMSDLAIRRLPDYFEFQVLERWFSDQTNLSFRQQAEDLMEFCDKCREHGIEVQVFAGPFDTHRLFRFTRLPTRKSQIESGSIIDI